MQADDLYGLALDQFIPERTALAKILRAGRQRDEANAVAALRKPSVAAWAVNQLVRSQGAAVGALYDAGDALRRAQENLLAGSGDGRALRAANERELRHVGLGLGESVFAVPAPPSATRTGPKRSAETTAQRAERERAAQQRAQAQRPATQERDRARAAARSEETAARRRVQRSEAALRVAQERRERAAAALAAADEALAAAQAEAHAAAAEHERARAALERL